jgi:pyrophosphatase PpaX
MKKTLYLFDIDGTLVDFLDIHVESYQHAYNKVLGVMLPKEEFTKQFGMPEMVWTKQVFKKKGFDENKIEETLKEYRDYLFNWIENKEIPLLKSVKEFLDYLKTNNQFLGIVTGNTKVKGEIILSKANLINLFDVFSYAEGTKPRYKIVETAIKMAKEKGLEFDNIIVIGDTPFDVISGKKAESETKIFTVGVATGTFKREELENESPDLVIDSMKEYVKIVELVQ